MVTNFQTNKDKGSVTFEDDVDDYSNEPASLKDIVIAHIKKISEICCQELTAGY